MEIRELAAGETPLAYEALCELRAGLPVVASLECFAQWVDEQQRPQGYRLIGSFVAGRRAAVAAAGFRRVRCLAWGDAVHVDDLITLAAFRGAGHADALMRWILAEARRLGCEQLHLDSGTQRLDAHRFYLKHGFSIRSFHFSQRV
ncbi:MAG TPA: GNAT family N-acetyltransferase [Candidatus Acidoferrales bacterium]|nr:GNAT family N-acetyltransferase [Candidatus Acidoferrales bacterium]